MENLRLIPIYGRFGLKALAFNALVVIAIIATNRMVARKDYKEVVDRISFHVALFDHCAERLASANEADWPSIIEAMPRILYRQRVSVFDFEERLVHDSGFMRGYDGRFSFRPVLPNPYIALPVTGESSDPDAYIRFLLSLDSSSLAIHGNFRSMMNIRYPEGLDRVVLSVRVLSSSDGEGLVLVMSDSLVDILIHGRALKEWVYGLYAATAALSIALSVILARSVTLPLRRLEAYSRDILEAKWKEPGRQELPTKGEIGAICGSLKGIMEEQRRRAEHFKRFSADVVHELKTPLAAIRSGLELYAECADEGEKAGIYDRINRKILQMENLMDEIRFIGGIESPAEGERCDDLPSICAEALAEIGVAGASMDAAPVTGSRVVPVSREKVYQIFANLLKNAASFSPARGSVSVAIREEGGFMAIRVRDRGQGIRKEVFPHILNRFFTYRPEGEEKHSGLGLSIVDAIIRGCGGRIEYRNHPEGGAEFTCYLPIAG